MGKETPLYNVFMTNLHGMELEASSRSQSTGTPIPMPR